MERSIPCRPSLWLPDVVEVLMCYQSSVILSPQVYTRCFDILKASRSVQGSRNVHMARVREHRIEV